MPACRNTGTTRPVELKARGDHPIDFKGLIAVKDHRDHLKVCDMNGPGHHPGRQRHVHRRPDRQPSCKKGIDDPRNDILFVGYQAAGTPGRAIQKYSQTTRRLCRSRRRAQNDQGQGPHAFRLLRPRRSEGPGRLDRIHARKARCGQTGAWGNGRAKRFGRDSGKKRVRGSIGFRLWAVGDGR
jgi:hypothetical protein